MSFEPKFCPRSGCPSHSRSTFSYRCVGFFQRQRDERRVQRFLCLACKRRFSEQTFRLDYRLKRPDLLPLFFLDRISKVTHRQSARNQRCSRTTEERHFGRLSVHCRDFHAKRLAEVIAKGGLAGQIFLLDELETYEHHRKLKPVTVPVLIERETGFVLDTRAGAMAPRGKRSEAEEELKARHEKLEGKRRSESRKVVREAFERLKEVLPKERVIRMRTDQKPSYAQLLRQIFGERCEHRTTHSKRKRDQSNPLWPINHTLGRFRDNVSRLVRETWAAAKKRKKLAGHLAIFVCYRNYVRGKTNRTPRTTPAMALGAVERLWSVAGLLEWAVFPYGEHQGCGAVSRRRISAPCSIP